MFLFTTQMEWLDVSENCIDFQTMEPLAKCVSKTDVLWLWKCSFSANHLQPLADEIKLLNSPVCS